MTPGEALGGQRCHICPAIRLRRIPPGRFALLLALLPVNTTFIAFVALDERPSPLDLVGIAFVLAGVIYQQRDEAPTPAEDPVP